MCASAIFVVGTSGIPPKLNYRSIKSYKYPHGVDEYKSSLVSHYLCVYVGNFAAFQTMSSMSCSY